MKKKKVLVGMSGGVDSSVSAALLLEQGYEVVGAFMKNWTETCDWKSERQDAARVAAKLGIPFLTFDFEDEYRGQVVENMFKEFEAGRTPNPDVMCNKYIKFNLFIKEADRLECDYVATGHYARLCHLDRGVGRCEIPRLAKRLARDDKKESCHLDRGASRAERSLSICKGFDTNKDQSYFLWAVDPKVLPRILFPIGEMKKPDVRKKAQELELDIADKKDSTGICFVGEVDIQEFLKTRIPEDPGDVVTVDGEVIGKHNGINFYTIGQRHGLNIGGGTPYYVVEKRPETKELVVSSNFHPALFKKELVAINLNWFEKPTAPHKCSARIRYRQESQPCTISKIEKNRVEVIFDKEQRAVTPGQSIVFYNEDKMIGGGIIE